MAEAGAVGFRAAFRNPALARLLSAFAAVNLAEWSFVTALSIYAFRRGGTLAVGFVGFRFVPGALSSALLAPLVDRRAGILAKISVARTVLLAGAAALVVVQAQLPLPLLLVALDALVAAAYRPAQSGLLPALARTPGELSGAAAGISMVKTLSQAIGALAGGVAVNFIAPGSAMAGAAAVMALAAGLNLGLSAAPRGYTQPLAALRSGIEAIPSVLGNRDAVPLLVASGLRTFVRGLWTALMVVVALRVFSLGSSGVGVFNAAAGVGAVVAFPLTATLIGRPRLGGPCALSFLVAGLSLGLVGVVPAAGVAIAAIAVWGLAMALADATSLSLLHRLLDADPLTRTIGVLESIKLGAEGLGSLLAPALVALLGTRPALVAAAVPLPLAIVVSTPRLRRADLAASGRSRLVALLHGAGPLRRLDMATLEGVAARALRLELEPGDVLIRENESGDSFYVIESGEIELSQSGYAIGCLGPGTGLGERALLRAAPRSASATARTRADVLAIDREAFLDAITGRAPDADVPAATLARVVADPTARPLADVLGDISVLAEVAPERIQRLADGAGLERFGPGATVIQEGEAATALYVVLSGRALASIGTRPIRELWPGDSFGEIAIMHGVPRTATVTAIEPLLACRVPADALLAAIDATG